MDCLLFPLTTIKKGGGFYGWVSTESNPQLMITFRTDNGHTSHRQNLQYHHHYQPLRARGMVLLPESDWAVRSRQNCTNFQHLHPPRPTQKMSRYHCHPNISCPATSPDMDPTYCTAPAISANIADVGWAPPDSQTRCTSPGLNASWSTAAAAWTRRCQVSWTNPPSFSDSIAFSRTTRVQYR